MAIKPILFSSLMVEAILKGRKTQTRRIVKKKYDNTDIELRPTKYGPQLFEVQNDLPKPTKNPNGTTTHYLRAIAELAPKYNQGDFLWVRETWFSTRFDFKELLEAGITDHLRFKADYNYDPKTECVGRGWKPAIHMPKAAARIFLEVTKVRVARLQDVSESDAIAEGIEVDEKGMYRSYTINESLLRLLGTQFNLFRPENSFRSLWTSINGSESWESNPWVWVYEFKQIDKPKNF
ncbi:hypothetical protein HP439_13055 [Sphingobacterium shayense]|uniref:hypothetical protein n=1 Tax=Sphingobacterium shayense TaxID=626343 RepID=UPI001553747B|nr:hypothetical protein [Sphingobacterium shayense]NQD71651.1 hypothetical protein [Sphingobacterium shayense]